MIFKTGKVGKEQRLRQREYLRFNGFNDFFVYNGLFGCRTKDVAIRLTANSLIIFVLSDQDCRETHKNKSDGPRAANEICDLFRNIMAVCVFVVMKPKQEGNKLDAKDAQEFGGRFKQMATTHSRDDQTAEEKKLKAQPTAYGQRK